MLARAGFVFARHRLENQTRNRGLFQVDPAILKHKFAQRQTLSRKLACVSCRKTAWESRRKRNYDGATKRTGNGPTPDVIFNPPLQINGESVYWVDFKNYYAEFANRDQKWQPSAKLDQTARKYTLAFGKGAFVFAHGFCADLGKTCCALLLDARQLERCNF